MKKLFFVILAITLIFIFVVQANAALELLGQGTSTHGTYNLIYDPDRNVTWYDYSNAANTWTIQNAWAQSLTVTFGSFTYENWRLPTTPYPDSTCSYIQAQSVGYNCTGSEWGQLWYLGLGGSAGVPLADTGNFSNLEQAFYWADGLPTSSSNQYAFETGNISKGAGYQAIFSKTFSNGKAIAVMSGKAIAPEPISSLLFIAGGPLLAVRRLLRRKTEQSAAKGENTGPRVFL